MRRGRGQPGQRRHLLLGAARAGRGPLRLRLARRDPRSAARRRDRVDLATPTAAPPAWFSRAYPETLPVTREGRALRRRRPADVCPSSPEYRARRRGLARAARRALRRPPGRGDVARAQRVRRAAAAMLLRWQAFWRSGTGCAPLRRPGRAQRGLGHRVLGPALRRRGTRSTPPRANHTVVNPAQQLDFARFTSDELLACFRCSATSCTRSPRRAGHHQLHGHQLQVDRLLWRWAREVDVVANDHYLRRRASRQPHRPGHGRRPEPRSLGGGAAVAADGALHRRGELAAAQHRQAPRRDAPQQPRPRRPRVPTRCCSSSGGPPASARRSSTPRWCRTPAPTPASGARWCALGADLTRARPACAAAGSRPTSPSSGTGSPAGRWSWSGGPRADLSLPGADRRVLRGALARTPDRRLRPSGGGPVRLPARRRAEPLPAHRDGRRRTCTGYVEAGGTLLVSYFSGIVDEHDAVHSGRVPGRAARRARPVRSRSSCRCARARRSRSPTVSRAGSGRSGSARRGAVADRGLRRRSGRRAPGRDPPRVRRGTAWYVATRLDDLGARCVGPCAGRGGRDPPRDLPDDARGGRSAGDEHLFLINHDRARHGAMTGRTVHRGCAARC